MRLIGETMNIHSTIGSVCTVHKNVSPFDKNASAMNTFPLKISYKTVIFSIFWYPFVLFTLLPFSLCVLSAPLLIAICSSTQIFSFFLLPCLFFLLHFAMFSLCYLRPSCLLYALTVQVTASSCYSLSTSLRCHYCFFYNFHKKATLCAYLGILNQFNLRLWGYRALGYAPIWSQRER